MLVFLVSLSVVSICLLLHKAANDFTRPIDSVKVIYKYFHVIPHEATNKANFY